MSERLERIRSEWQEVHRTILDLGYKHVIKASNRLIADMSDRGFFLVVCGEFKRGKSTLINALLQKPNLLPTDVVPTTAAIHMIEYGEEPSFRLVPTEGNTGDWLPISPRALHIYSAEPSGGTEDCSNLAYLEVRYPDNLLKSGLVIIDTPGVNDLNASRMEITYGFLPRADAAIFVLDATQPVSKSEKLFLEEKLFKNPRPFILFLLNKFDLLDEAEKEDSLSAAKERLEGILGEQPMVLPCVATDSSSLELKAVGTQIGRLVNAPEREDMQANRFIRGAYGVMADLRNVLDDHSRLMTASLDELIRERGRLESEDSSFRNDIVRFADYIKENGYRKLTAMIAQSIDIAANQTSHDLLARSGTIGQVSAYVENSLQHDIELAQRRWFETKLPEIAAFIERFLAAVVYEYQSSFLGNLHPRIAGTRFSLYADGKEMAIHQPAKLLGVGDEENTVGRFAMPVAGALIAGLLFSGGMAAVGMAGGLLMHHISQKAKHEAALAELKGMIPGLVQERFALLRKHMESAVESWFLQLAQGISEDANERMTDYKSRIGEAIEAVSKGAEAKDAVLSRQKDVIDQLNEAEASLGSLAAKRSVEKEACEGNAVM
jgi:ribosome biogenesis GTPase A